MAHADDNRGRSYPQFTTIHLPWRPDDVAWRLIVEEMLANCTCCHRSSRANTEMVGRRT